MKNLLALVFASITFNCLAQEKLIPYREGKLWGYCNFKGKVKIEPQYYGAKWTENAPDGYYIVWDSLNRLITANSMILAKKNLGFYFNDTMFVAHGADAFGLGLYNLKGELLWRDTFRDITRVRWMPGVHYFIKGWSGDFRSYSYLALIEYDTVRQAIVSVDSSLDVFPASKVNFSRYIAFRKRNAADTSRINLEFDFGSQSYILAGRRLIKWPEEQWRDPARNYQNINLHIAGKNRLRHIIGRQYKYLGTEHMDTSMISLDADTMWRFIDSSILQPFYAHRYSPTDTFKLYRSSIIYRKNAKYGVVAGMRVHKALYDTVSFMIRRPRQAPCFLVGMKTRKGLKWGVLDCGSGKLLLPCKYDQIDVEGRWGWNQVYFFPTTPLIVIRNNKYGMVRMDGKFIYRPVYDSIIMHHTYKYTVHKRNKHGLYQDSTVFSDAVFPYIPKDVVFIGKDYFFRFADKDLNIIGYGDKRGYLYFKD